MILSSSGILALKNYGLLLDYLITTDTVEEGPQDFSANIKEDAAERQQRTEQEKQDNTSKQA
jgi:hypothetical protein